MANPRDELNKLIMGNQAIDPTLTAIAIMQGLDKLYDAVNAAAIDHSISLDAMTRVLPDVWAAIVELVGDVREGKTPR